MADPRTAAATSLITAIDELLQALSEYCRAPYRTLADLAPLRQAHAYVVGLAAAAGLPAPPAVEESGLSYWRPVVMGDKTAYTNRQRLGRPGAKRQEWKARLLELRDAAAIMVANAEVSGQRKRRRLPPKTITRLTPKQVEAMQLVGEHKGNVSAAARAAGKSRPAMQKLYERALEKMASKAPVKPKTQGLPHDRRGQAMVADDTPGDD